MEAYQSYPHPALQKYIAQYLFLSLNNASELGDLKQMFFPLDINGLAFFSEKLAIDNAKTRINSKAHAVYTGLITSPSSLTFPENSKVEGFIVSFKPYGFSELFRINASDATDYFPDFSSLTGREGDILYEQIMEANMFSAKIKIANEYFIKKIPRHDNINQVREACHLIMMNDGSINIKSLANNTNMSLSCLERQFTKKIGVSPKMFSRFKRFHYAVSLINSPNPYPLLKSLIKPDIMTKRI